MKSENKQVKYDENLVKLIAKDQQKFAQDCFYVKHLSSIYDEEGFTELNQFMDKYISKVPQKIIDKEKDKTTFDEAPSVLSQMENQKNPQKQDSNHADTNLQQNEQAFSKMEKAFSDQHPELISIISNDAQKQEQNCAMPQRRRPNINFTQPFAMPVKYQIDKNRKQENYVGITRGDHQIKIKSQILFNAQQIK